MKKKNFLSRINAKLALAVVALTSAFFVGCSEEKLDINQGGGTTELPNPVCTITVTVLDMTTGENVANPSLTASAGTISGNTITLTGESIPAQSITITAAAGDVYTKDGSVTVSVPALTKGQSLSMDATILMVQKGSDKDYVLTSVNKTLGEATASTKTYTDEAWVAGEEAIEKITLTVAKAGTSGYKVEEAEGLTDIAQGIYDEMKKNEPTAYDIVFADVNIPANHKATVEVTTTETKVTYTVIESNGTSARQSTFDVVEYASSAFYTVTSTDGSASSAAPKYTIYVTVQDATTSEELDVATVTVDPEKYKLEDGAIVITDPEKIEQQTVTITYPENENYYGNSETVIVPELNKGSDGNVSVVIKVVKKSTVSLPTDWVIVDAVFNMTGEDHTAGNLLRTEYAYGSADSWYEFTSLGHVAYILDTNVKYTFKKGWKVPADSRATVAETMVDFKEMLKAVETFTTETVYSEWYAMYDYTRLVGRIQYDVYGREATITITNGVETKTLSVTVDDYWTLATFKLEDLPGHDHHGHSHSYNPNGHGHAHGEAGNAGGGITIPAN